MNDFYNISSQPSAETEREATYQDQISADPSSYITYDFDSPTDLVVMFNRDIREGRATLYPWQVETHEKFAELLPEGKVNRQAVVAANGSGKSQFVLAPCAVWFGMRFKQSRTVITSSSGAQLDKQTCDAIVLLLQEINNTLGEKVWKINYRHYTNMKTGSEIICYATDEPGKAEGFHPKVIGGKFAILIDEGKSIPEPIYEAISRCNGLTHRIDVSSPGGMHGHFYRVVTGGRWRVRKVTYRDCLHISDDEVEEAKIQYGENSPIFRSMYLAEFTSTEETIVITLEQWIKWQRVISSGTLLWYNKGKRRAGVDIASTGKCESVFSPWDGGQMLPQEAFHIGDTTWTAQHLKYLINKYDIPPDEVNIDDGNVGKSIIDMLWRDGYAVNRVINQTAALDTRVYGNRGAEMYFTFARGCMDGVLQPVDEPVFSKQITSRYYRTHKQNAKIILEPKQEAIANGHGSPDRADAAVLAFAKCNPWIFDKWREEAGSIAERPEPTKRAASSLTTDDILRLNEQRKFAGDGQRRGTIRELPGSQTRGGRSNRIREILTLAKRNTFV